VGDPTRLHGLGIPAPVRRLVRWCEADRPAVVIGSAQRESDVADGGGLAVVRRRSGGSAVVVGPGRLVWADVVLPAGDPLWADDVGVAPLWLGRCWADALGQLGIEDLSVHDGAMARGRWGHLVCFGGVGPGEVLAGGRKVVGISQRRTRLGALFQVAVLLRWDPVETVGALAMPPGDRQQAIDDLAIAAVGVGPGVAADDLERAFLAATTGP
jgi:lipoate---protein ligase